VRSLGRGHSVASDRGATARHATVHATVHGTERVTVAVAVTIVLVVVVDTR
jgi:hypothetical protein